MIFGPAGRGRNAGDGDIWDHIASDTFAVIDERTAVDNTLLFVIEESVDRVQEAEIRVAWKKGSELDKALVRYASDQNSDDDIALLLLNMDSEQSDNENVENDESVEGKRARFEALFDQIWDKTATRWFEFRLRAETAVQHIHIINDKVLTWCLLNRKYEFDEHGVFIGRYGDT